MDAGPAIIAEFVEPGVARLVYRQFPVIAPLSASLADASECAVDQKRFWAFHDAVFARLRNQALRGERDVSAIAQEARLDVGAFEACRRAGQVRRRVEADFNVGRQRGVEATPTVFVNAVKIVGNQPIDVFRAKINAARPK